MSEPEIGPCRALPRWLACLIGTAVAVHLGAIVLLVLGAQSGPWPTPFGPSPSVGPPFAAVAGNTVTQRYLAPLKLTHNYHFLRSRPGQPDVFLEVRLKDEAGKVTETLRFPDPQANAWVRHRQKILVAHLADDMPVQSPGGEAIPAPNQAVRTVEIWDVTNDGSLALRKIPEHLVPRDRQVFRPSEWSMILARSYGRHLCRAQGAASVELIRHTREAIMPAALYSAEQPPDLFQELVTNFGEIKK